MPRPTPLALALLFSLAACRAPLTPAQPVSAQAAVEQARAEPDAGFVGLVEFQVRKADLAGEVLYLNSDPNYRDPKNLTVTIPAPLVRTLLARLELRAWEDLRGRTVRVKGRARRVRIDILDASGKPSGAYYHQVHLRVDGVDQIQLVNRLMK